MAESDRISPVGRKIYRSIYTWSWSYRPCNARRLRIVLSSWVITRRCASNPFRFKSPMHTRAQVCNRLSDDNVSSFEVKRAVSTVSSRFQGREFLWPPSSIPGFALSSCFQPVRSIAVLALKTISTRESAPENLRTSIPNELVVIRRCRPRCLSSVSLWKNPEPIGQRILKSESTCWS